MCYIYSNLSALFQQAVYDSRGYLKIISLYSVRIWLKNFANHPPQVSVFNFTSFSKGKISRGNKFFSIKCKSNKIGRFQISGHSLFQSFYKKLGRIFLIKNPVYSKL